MNLKSKVKNPFERMGEFPGSPTKAAKSLAFNEAIEACQVVWDEEIKRLLDKIEAEFIWGQVPVNDLRYDKPQEWTMRCMKDEWWQAIKAEFGGK